MEKKDDNDSSEFVEEIIEEKLRIKPNPKKIINKLILGKKTLIRKKIKVPPHSPPSPIKEQKIEQKSNAEILVESIVKTYWVSKWKEQTQIMKYSKQGFNKKRANFRSFCTKMNNAMKYHQYLYLALLFDKMDKLPKKENFIHDNNYGTLKFVKDNNNNNYIKKDLNEIIIKTEEQNEKNEINKNNINNNEVEIKIDLPEIKEVEFKPENEEELDKKKNNEKNNMDIEKNIDDKKS